jgi:IPT/TIG domain
VHEGWSNASTTVLVSGTDFTGATGVTIGKVPVASFTVLSNTQLRVVFPAQPAGTWVNISVTTPGGPSFANSQTDVKYLRR